MQSIGLQKWKKDALSYRRRRNILVWVLMGAHVTHVKLEKALRERRYLCQGKAIRQVASPSWLCQRFAYAPFNAMVTNISKWPWIQDSCRITPKIESLVVCAMPNTPSKFQKDPSITFWVILLTHRQTDRQTDKQKLAKTLPTWRR